MMFISVILPLPLPKVFTYAVQPDLENDIQVGVRVIVPFGKSKLITGIVYELNVQPQEDVTIKSVEEVLDAEPVVFEKQFRFWFWLADYYMCHIGEVMNAALPSGLKLTSTTRVILNESIKIDPDKFTDREYIILEALQSQFVLSLEEVSDILGIKSVQPIIQKLVNKNAIFVEEEIGEKYKEKKEKWIRLNAALTDEESLNSALDELFKTPAQLKLMMNFLSLCNLEELVHFKISKKGLKKKFSFTDGVLKSLIEKRFLDQFEESKSRLSFDEEAEVDSVTLSPEQNEVFDAINHSFTDKNTVLLEGVTGSGKTEIYIQLIKDQLEKGKQVLYLLPEIALTTQLIQRLKAYFGDRIGVYHSRFNANERVEIWNAVSRSVSDDANRYDIIIGARSCLFLPYNDLGLVIVDEEHETSFKQFDPAPRYHARDAAMVLASLHQAKCLLGSATPSIESKYNATIGKYGFVHLKKRYSGVQLPEVFCADMQRERKKKLVKGHFSSLLLQHMEATIEAGDQIILFQNRRGFAPMMECQSCGHSPQCKRCDVTLTYHKYVNLLKCHYCGYSQKPQRSCNNCGSLDTELRGFGTEQIEEEVSQLFPKLRVARMDLDTTRSKNAYSNIIQDFEERNIDVLIGTQMVTKGLDFDHVGLVGILNADSMLNFPDFRAHERAYQLMSQVAGRSGRKKKRGKVVIQSANPEHYIIRNVISHNYQEMYDTELLIRKNFYYPPFYRLIKITVVHHQRDLVDVGSDVFAKQMTKLFGSKSVLGPEFPVVARVRNLYHKVIMIKVDRKFSINEVKHRMNEEIEVFSSDQQFKKLRLLIDVDPF